VISDKSKDKKRLRKQKKRKGKQKSHRYNHLPLLPSRPGGFSRSWSHLLADTKLWNY